MRKYPVKWSKSVKTITFFVNLLLVLALLPLIKYSQAPGMGSIITIIFIICIPTITFLFSPQSIILTDNEVIIKKNLGKVIIPFNEIASISTFKMNYKGIRIFGSGGYFGFMGIFSNPDIGYYDSYVGDQTKSLIIIRKDKKKIIISCDQPGEVLEYIKEKIKV